MLTALLSGAALTARELAAEAGVSPQTASSHLRHLTDRGLVDSARQGRHVYVRLAGSDVARAIEPLLGLAGRAEHLRHRPGRRGSATTIWRVPLGCGSTTAWCGAA